VIDRDGNATPDPQERECKNAFLLLGRGAEDWSPG
jgi:hypothetical protein